MCNGVLGFYYYSDCNQKQPLGASAKAVMCNPGTVCNVKKRYLSDSLDEALYDKPRPGAMPKITDEVEAHLIALMCSYPPKGQALFYLATALYKQTY